jgi:transcriptional regulator
VTIYIPPYFAGDAAAAHRLIAEHPFATLITTADGSEPHVTYLPLLLRDDALWGHVARPNPHWERFAAGRTLAIFHGPHAFVSPRWYERPADNVPTWNYAVVHVHGHPELLDDDGAYRVVKDLAGRFDDGVIYTRADRVRGLLKGIVAFRMPVERLEIKLKMNQNKTAADRAGVIAGLRATGRAENAAVADWMARAEFPLPAKRGEG